MTDIKNTLDVLDVLPKLIKAYHAAMADGTVDWKDLLNQETRDLIPAIRDAISDGSLIPSELTDLDAAEAGQIYAKLRDMVMEVMALFV